jgi:two-component system cell cycle sensor histidine kinase/response regulator CckA
MTTIFKRLPGRFREMSTHPLFPWIVIALVIAAYTAAFPWLYQRLGQPARIFALGQVCLAAWFWGIRGGMLIILFNVLLHLVLIKIFSGKLVVSPLSIVAGLFLGILIGRLASVSRQLRVQLVQRRRAEEELRQHRDQLEQVVEDRTAELRETNQELRREISERRQTEEALRQSEERYRELFDSINDLVYTHDLDGKFLSINPTPFQRLGYSTEEIIGRPITDFLPTENHQAFIEEYLTSIEHTTLAEGVLRILAKDRTPHYIEYRNSLVRPEGETAYVSGMGRDVTERILAERELRDLEEQLLQAQKMEAIGNLAGGVAHDFNNILQAVSGYIELLRTSREPIDPNHSYLAEIETVVKSATGLLRQLLTFSRREKIPLQPLDLNQEVRQTVGILKRTIPRMIDIQTRLAEDLKPANANQTQLEQVIMNLVTNAKDAMPQGGRLVISTRNVTLDEKFTRPLVGVEPGEYLCLTVSDTGQGMDPETLQHIFEPFFTTKDPGRGTGLGLSTVYGIIKRHGGHITCFSAPGQGTTFHVYLPALEQMEVTAEPREAEPVTGGQETILLVDDEPAILKIARDILERYGYSVLTARSGEEALKIYGDQAADIGAVVLDLNMPGMGGPACLEELRRLNSRAKVLVASGYTPDEQQGVRDLADGLLSKPYRLTDLLRKVREVLDA